ncbi:MAG: viroplasmin family protein [Saprospiraceae bacterium]
MAKKKKYYVVWEGNDTGVFDTWAKCQLQIKGYPNAKYKSFPSKMEAEMAFRDGPYAHINSGSKSTKTKKRLINLEDAPIEWNSLSVDAACSGNPGDMEYRGVDTKTGDEIFRMGPFKKGTNNVGEFLALVHGLAHLQKHGHTEMPIYSDSKIAINWVRQKTIRTKLEKSWVNERLFKLIDRGVYWLKNNSYKNPILKWETKEWGEIPADFGRK